MGYKKVNDDSLSAVAAAIKRKIGSQNSLTFPAGFESAIDSIAGGASLPTLTNPAATTDVLDEKEYIDGNGAKQKGSIETASDSGLPDLYPGDDSKTYAGGKYYPNSHGAEVPYKTPTFTLGTGTRLPGTELFCNSSGTMSSTESSTKSLRRFMRSVKVNLGGDIYRVETGSFVVSTDSVKTKTVTDLPFTPVGAVVFLMARDGNSNSTEVCYGQTDTEFSSGRSSGGAYGTSSGTAARVYANSSSITAMSFSSGSFTIAFSDVYLKGTYGYVAWGR